MKKQIKALLRYPCLVLFFGFIVLFSLADCLTADRDTSELENRQLAKKPTLTSQNLLAQEEKQKFSYLYETYVNDQFLGRDGWISLKSRAEDVLLKQENNSIVYGENGSMYQKFFTLNEEQFDKNTAAIAEFMARYPGLVTAMVVPSADRISPEAPNAPFVNEAPYMEKLDQAFSQNGSFVDLTDLFLAHNDQLLYYRTDHHWTTEGAFLAYQAYMQQIGRTPAFDPSDHTLTKVEDFYGTLYSKSKLYSAKPDTLSYYSDLENRLVICQGATKTDREAAAAAGLSDLDVTLYDLAKLSTRDKYAMFLYSNNAFSQLYGEGSGKILVIKDSYANCFVPFLTADYERIDVVDLRSLNASMDTILAENNYDQVLILYNFQSYAEDTNLVKLNLFH